MVFKMDGHLGVGSMIFVVPLVSATKTLLHLLLAKRDIAIY